MSPAERFLCCCAGVIAAALLLGALLVGCREVPAPTAAPTRFPDDGAIYVEVVPRPATEKRP